MGEKTIPGRCNHHKDDGGYCEKYPAKDDFGDEINGDCYIHLNSGNEDYPNYKHGINTDRSSYYQNLAPEDQALVDNWIDSFLERADWDKSHTGNMELLRGACINLHKIRGANDYIDEEGLVQDEYADTDDFGDPIYTDGENVLLLPNDRLSREVKSTLDFLGVNEKSDDAEDMAKSLTKLFESVMD